MNMALRMMVRDKLNIHIIGAGGTGGYAAAYLARLLAGGKHTIHLYDGDQVETKNLKRQNFTLDDLDKNKAEVLCDRIIQEILHAPKMIPHDQYITSKETLLAEILLSLEDDESLVIVMAVDNIATRKLINEVIMDDLVKTRILTVALDSGNDNQGGQVVLYGNAVATWQPPLGEEKKGILPNMLQIYPELATIEDDNPGLITNCAENAESQPQAMMCNVRNGELIAQIITRILETHKSPGNLWQSDILTGNTHCKFTGFQQEVIA